MGVTTGTLTMVVGKLEQRGLLRRRPNAADRRSILMELTEAGRERFLEHEKLHDKLHADLTRDIVAEHTGEEITCLAGCLRKLNRGF